MFALAGCTDDSNGETDGGTTEADRGPDQSSEQNTTADSDQDIDDSGEKNGEDDGSQTSESPAPSWTTWISEREYNGRAIQTIEFTAAVDAFGDGPLEALRVDDIRLKQAGIDGYAAAERYVGFVGASGLTEIITGDIQPSAVLDEFEVSASQPSYKEYDLYEIAEGQIAFGDDVVIFSSNAEAAIDARAGDAQRMMDSDGDRAAYAQQFAGDPIVGMGPPQFREEVSDKMGVSGYALRDGGQTAQAIGEKIYAFESVQERKNTLSGLGDEEIALRYQSPPPEWNREVQDVTRDDRYLRLRFSTDEGSVFVRYQ